MWFLNYISRNQIFHVLDLHTYILSLYADKYPSDMEWERQGMYVSRMDLVCTQYMRSLCRPGETKNLIFSNHSFAAKFHSACLYRY
ncbi:hypothetical protein Agabi119p4_6911 [Agaricus bisporus var. burnettii]|uniref:Uncharacterized protein n=1 Tax=Agaricus bisporus var. burnettii TaxID=192524 RepID=A0A8H7F0G2_AGABI|nr:hypothetical protein Agabi119p4_6911 [Agaricus bisporus var. burnettii]